MSSKTLATILVGGGALAAWLANASTSNREIPPVPVVRTAPVEMRGAELANEIVRLHDRLRPDAPPRQPGRNLFSFRAAPAPHAPPPQPLPPPVFLTPPPSAVRPESGLTLAGVAEDPGPDGATVRTAIISSAAQVFLVKIGDKVTDRYRVASITADAVELTDSADGRSLRLALK